VEKGRIWGKGGTKVGVYHKQGRYVLPVAARVQPATGAGAAQAQAIESRRDGKWNRKQQRK